MFTELRSLQACRYCAEAHLFMHAHTHTRPVVAGGTDPNPEIIMALLPNDPGCLPAALRLFNPRTVRGR